MKKKIVRIPGHCSWICVNPKCDTSFSRSRICWWSGRWLHELILKGRNTAPHASKTQLQRRHPLSSHCPVRAAAEFTPEEPEKSQQYCCVSNPYLASFYTIALSKSFNLHRKSIRLVSFYPTSLLNSRMTKIVVVVAAAAMTRKRTGRGEEGESRKERRKEGNGGKKKRREGSKLLIR